MTRTEEEIEVEVAALWAVVSKLASSLMWRTAQYVDVPVPQVMEEPTMKLSGVLPSCGDGTERGQVLELMESRVELAAARSLGPENV